MATGGPPLGNRWAGPRVAMEPRQRVATFPSMTYGAKGTPNPRRAASRFRLPAHSEGLARQRRCRCCCCFSRPQLSPTPSRWSTSPSAPRRSTTCATVLSPAVDAFLPSPFLAPPISCSKSPPLLARQSPVASVASKINISLLPAPLLVIPGRSSETWKPSWSENWQVTVATLSTNSHRAQFRRCMLLNCYPGTFGRKMGIFVEQEVASYCGHAADEFTRSAISSLSAPY